MSCVPASKRWPTRPATTSRRCGPAVLPVPELKVDGGATRNNLLCQFQADILGIPVRRPVELERTALGVAHLAGMGVGLWKQSDLSDRWQVDRIFEPEMSEDQREQLCAGWQAAVRAATGKAG